MRYTAAFRLHAAIADAVAVEWTDADAPEASNAGWEACVRLPDGDWRFADHDVDPALASNWRDAGVFANIGLRYRLSPSGPWSPVSRSRKSITLVAPEEPAAVPPALVAAPALAGPAVVGAAVGVDPGSWSGRPAPATALQWCRDGVAIAGATGAGYTPVAADDRTALSCRVTATNVAGSAVATTAALAVTRAAPVASGTLADVTLAQGAAAGSVAAAAAFTGGGLGYAVAGTGATIDAATGVVSLPTAALVTARAVTVTASNSGGSASAGFRFSVVKDDATVVSTRQALLDAIVASSDGDVIRIAPGVYDRFIWPKNTSHRLTLAPLQVDNPPIMRGIWINSASNVDDYYPSQAVTGDWARNLTIDGLRFQAELLTSMRQSRTGAPVDIRGPDGRGYGWRADFSYPGIANTGENAGFVGLKLGGNSSDIVVQNCLFEQYSKGLNVQCDRLTVQHCEFSEICEDAVIIWGGTDLSFRYNVWTNSRGVSLAAAKAYGWKNDEPVHQDFFQIACNSASQFVTRLDISYNVIFDDTERVHGVLLNNAYVGGSTDARLQGSRHRDVVIDNNFLKVTHTTALQLTNVAGLKARRNKVVRNRVIAGSTKNDVALIVGAWGAADAQNCEDITVQNNVSRKYKGPWMDSWVWTGNAESNDDAVLPPGWVEIRPELVRSGRRAGRYGNPG